MAHEHRAEQPAHRRVDPDLDVGFTPAVARRNALALAVGNGVGGVGLLVLPAGSAPSLLFLEALFPTPVWGVLFVIAAALLSLGRHEAGHLAATVVWVMVAAGAGLGLVTARTTSPAGSVLLLGAVISITLVHVNGLAYRSSVRRRHNAERR